MTRSLGLSIVAAISLLALEHDAGAHPATTTGAAKRKATPDKFAKAAGEAFAAAVTADQANDLPTALGLYQKAYGISPHPSTVYNIADVQRRLANLPLAIKSYETYLLLSPNARDRADVEALLEQLRRTPGTLLVSTGPASNPKSIDLPAAYVLVSGRIEKKPGPLATPKTKTSDDPVIELFVAAGEHTIDVVTPLTYGRKQCNVQPGAVTRCEVFAPPRIDGAVIVSGDRRFRTYRNADRRTGDVVGERFELPAGRHKLALRDRSYECAPIVLDVGAVNTVAYVYVSSAEYHGLQRCRTLDTKHHRLQFDP
ncbi:MAG: hypothetical protein H0T89_21985 [Deltaproteobacteria bacterium]|nr:hypothetical protein [Deltaproteobacteria bacterium]MDQ3297820.1 hypothetical protein [Myxococcota bacterium]